jgi:hypothetical protein
MDAEQIQSKTPQHLSVRWHVLFDGLVQVMLHANIRK